MRLIYVAGPYRAPTKQGIEANIYAAQYAAKELWKEGWAVICPHANSQGMDGIVPEETFLEGDLEILRRCDAIYMMAGWEASAGATNELQEAIDSGLEIMFEESCGGEQYEISPSA